jgi:hypothetical protein
VTVTVTRFFPVILSVFRITTFEITERLKCKNP